MELNTYRTNEPDVIYQLFDNEMVVIHLPTGCYHSLNGVAGDIYLALGSDGASTEHVATSLAAKYDAPSATISADLELFLEQLRAESLVVRMKRPNPEAPQQAAQKNGNHRVPYLPPSFQSFKDVQELLLLDPIHDVSAAGWPNLPESSCEVHAGDGVRLRLAGPDVIFERFDEETVAINLSTRAYYTLYGPAEDIFLLLQEKPTLEEIQKALASKYVLAGVDVDALLEEYLSSLKKAGLVSAEPLTVGEPILVRDLAIERQGSELPFSKLSFEIFRDADYSPESAARIGTLCAAKQRYCLPQGDFYYAAAKGGMVLIDRETGSYYRLNEPAADVFKLLHGMPSVQDIASALLEKYETSTREMKAATIIFISNVVRMKLVNAVPAEDHRTAAAVSLDVPAAKLPLQGFDIAWHKDLMEVMRPVNLAPPAPRPVSPGTSTQLCSRLRQFFEESAARLGSTDAHYEVGGAKLRVQWAGDKQYVLHRALSHLGSAGAAAEANLTIRVWDATVPPSDHFLRLVLENLHNKWTSVCGPRGEVQGFHTERLPVIYHPGPDALSVIDVEHGQAYFLKRDESPFPYWEIGGPFRYIFHSWFASRGSQFVHGAAVGTSDGGILLAGRGGTGKSTTSMLCVKSGLLYAGDDYCLADPQAGYLHSLYNTGKLTGTDDLERLPELTGRSQNSDGFENGGDGKGVYFIPDIWPGRLISGFPLRAILLPRISGYRDTWLEECSPAESLLGMLASTVAQLPLADQADCDRLARLAEKIPGYVLHIGTELEQIPAKVREALG